MILIHGPATCQPVAVMEADSLSRWIPVNELGTTRYKSVMHEPCDTRPTITFLTAEHHQSFASIKLFCLMTEARGCEQHNLVELLCSCALTGNWSHSLLITRPMPHQPTLIRVNQRTGKWQKAHDTVWYQPVAQQIEIDFTKSYGRYCFRAIALEAYFQFLFTSFPSVAVACCSCCSSHLACC